jgi:hypothetical protein
LSADTVGPPEAGADGFVEASDRDDDRVRDAFNLMNLRSPG